VLHPRSAFLEHIQTSLALNCALHVQQDFIVLILFLQTHALQDSSVLWELDMNSSLAQEVPIIQLPEQIVSQTAYHVIQDIIVTQIVSLLQLVTVLKDFIVNQELIHKHPLVET